MTEPRKRAGAKSTEVSILTDAMISSGEWIREATVIELTGLHATSLRDKRQKSLVRAVPSSRGASGQGRSFWYHRDDVELLVARRSTKRVGAIDSWDEIQRELELSMAQAEIRQLELARAHDETERVRVEAAAVQGLLETEISQLKAEVARLRAGILGLIGQNENLPH